jgi:hypothetical protein
VSDAPLMLRRLARSLSGHELRWIAERDYGLDVERHLDALRNLIGLQDLVLADDQSWYPLETIQLCANHLEPGHEREFAFCTLFLLQRVREGIDHYTDPVTLFENGASHYDALPEKLRDAILDAFLSAGVQ